jgi:sec-independent protein translocase protein TatC
MSSSGVVDEDTARTINEGRETLGVMLRTVQKKLQKVFIFFTVGMLGGVVAMRAWIWPTLKADLLARGADVIAQTPFDVILLQIKIGLILGILFIVPPLLYYAREPLKERGVVPEDVHVSRWKLAAMGVLSMALFVGGILYGYYVFFPIMFDFLASNALGAGFAPLYSIVHWTQFIMVLGFSFGIAAQLPLAMTALSYYGVVPYETFRAKWKYAVVGIFAFGALFSPPDPFTQIMWASPLLMLFGFSLYLSKVVTTLKRAEGQVSVAGTIREQWNRLAGVAVLASGAAYAAVQASVVERVNEQVLASASVALPTLPEAVGLPRPTAAVVLAAAAGVAAAVALLLYYVYRVSQAAAAADRTAAPADIDFDALDAAGVRAAPPEAFTSLTEEQAVEVARRAMDDDRPEKARAVLDRFDENGDQAADDEAGEDGDAADADAAEAAVDAADEAADAAEADDAEDDEGGVVTRTSAGVVNAFTEDETTKDDIGGYYYDIAFIFDSLRSRLFHIVAVFMLVLAGVFAFLYRGGIGYIRRDFLSRLPAGVRPEDMDIVTLHPVEALVFEVKISTVLAAIAIVPMVLYYAWPAMEDRGLVTGDRRAIAVWGGSLLVSLVAGSVVGYLFVAPSIISYLVADAVQAGMIINYRVNNFFWLVFLTTVGIGLFASIPTTMALFHAGGLVSYDTMRRRWRVVAIGSFGLAALLTPDSLYTMFIIAVPVCVAYGIGLGLLWVMTLGGRRGRPGASERAA